jgi:glycosyltransferase involved in cell wall biosynthesis
MLIGIEAERANNPQKTGVEHYAKQLILHLAKIDKDNSYILYLRTSPEDWFKSLPGNFKVKVIPFPIFWTQVRISLEMLLHPVDVLFIPASALPILHPKTSVVTIHDVAWRYFPDSFTWFMRNFLEWSTKFAVKNAGRVIAVSQSTKNDLIKFYGAPVEKIKVVYHGYEDNQPDSRKKPEVSLPDKFVFFLSTLQPRKNLEGLIAAFKQLKKDNPELPHKLVVAGRPGWKFESILKVIDENKNFVFYLNHVSDQDRLAILKRADLLVLPSFYEGFGMQILESFEANTPVAASNISSMPEVAGPAAAYFDPKDPGDIARAIKMVLTDKSLADNLRAKGRERLKDFSWEKCARETLEVLKKIK